MFNRGNTKIKNSSEENNMANIINVKVTLTGVESEVNQFIKRVHIVDENGSWCLEYENIISLPKDISLSDTKTNLCMKIFGSNRSIGFEPYIEGNVINFIALGDTPIEFFVEASKIYKSILFDIEDSDEHGNFNYKIENGVILNSSRNLEDRDNSRKSCFEKWGI